MTYYGRAANEHVDLHLALVVEGIPFVFVERSLSTTPAGYGGRTPIVCLTRVEEGEAAIDFAERRETASTLDVEMLDDGDTLADLFAAGTRAVGWISNDFTASETDLEVNSTTPYSAGQRIYVGAETITIGTITAPNDLVGCTRGVFGSTAVPLSGTLTDGDEVYTVPPFWRGRRAWLYGYAPDGAGIYTETLLGTYIVDEAPRHAGDLRWSLRLAGVVQEYWERSVGVGLRDARTTDYGTAVTDTTFSIEVDDVDAFRAPAADWPVYVRVDDKDVTHIVELVSVDVPGSTITLDFRGHFGTPDITNTGTFTPAAWTVRPMAVVQAPGSASILVVLLSDDGQDLSGGNYLPGRDPSSTHDPGWRLGAGFTASEVDTAAFDDITAVPSMAIVIDDERKVTDILREWALLTGTVIVSTVDGKIKPITLAAQRTSGTRTIGADDVIPDGPIAVEHDEGSVYPLASIRCGYSPVTGDFTDEVNLINTSLAKRYRRTPQRRELEFRSVDIFDAARPRFAREQSGGWLHPARYTPGEAVTMLSDIMRGDGALARRFVSLSLSHEHLDLRLGDRVTIGADLPDAYDLPDFRGSTIVGATCRVVARRPRYDQARVDVRLEVLDRLLHVCPSAIITADDGAGTLTLATTTPEVPGSGFPGNGFWIGAVVKMYDRSSLSGVAVVQSATVTAIPATNQITVSPKPTFTVQANVDYVVLDPEASADGTNGDGYTLIEMAKLADDDGTAGSNASADNEPRWR